jgi:hypothetical protein
LWALWTDLHVGWDAIGSGAEIMKVGIIGAGTMGLTLAHRLSAAGLDVEVLLSGPIVPHDLKTSCLPGFLVRWTIRNRAGCPRRDRAGRPARSERCGGRPGHGCHHGGRGRPAGHRLGPGREARTGGQGHPADR